MNVEKTPIVLIKDPYIDDGVSPEEKIPLEDDSKPVFPDPTIPPEPTDPDIDPCSLLPAVYYTDNIMTAWNVDRKVGYKDGILSYTYLRYNPELFQRWKKCGMILPGVTNEGIPRLIHLTMMLSSKFSELGWIEQLGIIHVEAVKYFHEHCFDKLNGKTAKEAFRWMIAFQMQPNAQLNIHSIGFGAFENAALISGAHRSQRFGEGLMDFPIKALYTMAAIVALPQIAKALPDLIKTFPEAIKSFAEITNMAIQEIRDKFGMNKDE